MSENLKISISGVRGVVGVPDGLTPSLIVDFTCAFSGFLGGGKVVVGSDTRPTGGMVKNAVLSALIACGCDVVDIGITPTPMVLFMVRHLRAAGGIVITASHNPLDWNALKLVSRKGCFLDQKQADKVMEFYKKGEARLVSWKNMGKVTVLDKEKTQNIYLDAVLKAVDVKKIIKSKFTVAIDPVNGAGAGGITRRFLEKLGCKVFSVNEIPNGIFGRKAEPLPENIGELCRLVKSKKADMGFAQDPDADRLAIVSEKGVPLGEEYTLALAIDHALGKRKSPVVINNATSLASERTADRHGVRVFRTKIGEINVTSRMFAVKSVIGGEGNGGVIYMPVNTGRDSFIGMALILERMAETGKKISELKAELPQFEIVKRTMPGKGLDVETIESGLLKKYHDKKNDHLDGIKIYFEEAWVIVRPSNTEPIVRIIAEARTKDEAEKLAEQFIKDIKSLM